MSNYEYCVFIINKVDYIYNFDRAIGLMSRMFTNGAGDRGSNLGRVKPKTKKMVLDANLLSHKYSI